MEQMLLDTSCFPNGTALLSTKEPYPFVPRRCLAYGEFLKTLAELDWIINFKICLCVVMMQIQFVIVQMIYYLVNPNTKDLAEN